MTERTRREFLGAAGGAALSGLAGCSLRTPLPEDVDPAAPTRLDERAATQFRGGLARRGYRDATIPERVEVDWELEGVNTGEHTAAKSSPVAAPTGDVVIAGDTGEVRAVRPDGRVRWTAEVEPTTRGIHGTPAIANGTVYVGAYDGATYAFDLRTGDRRWRSDLGDAIGSSPAYYNGLLYVAVEYDDPDGSLFALDAASGRPLWEDDRPTDHPHSTPALDLDAGRLVVGSNDGNCYAWSFPGLDHVWTAETGGAIKGAIATHGGRAYFGSWDERVYCVDLADGGVEWTFEADADVMTSPGIDPEGTVYVGSHDDRLYALDGEDGTERWRFETGGWLIGAATVTRGHVLAGSYDANLYAVRRDDGTEAWRVENDGYVTSAPLVHDGGIYYAERATEEEPGSAYRLRAA